MSWSKVWWQPLVPEGAPHSQQQASPPCSHPTDSSNTHPAAWLGVHLQCEGGRTSGLEPGRQAAGSSSTAAAAVIARRRLGLLRLRHGALSGLTGHVPEVKLTRKGCSAAAGRQGRDGQWSCGTLAFDQLSDQGVCTPHRCMNSPGTHGIDAREMSSHLAQTSCPGACKLSSCRSQAYYGDHTTRQQARAPAEREPVPSGAHRGDAAVWLQCLEVVSSRSSGGRRSRPGRLPGLPTRWDLGGAELAARPASALTVAAVITSCRSGARLVGRPPGSAAAAAAAAALGSSSPCCRLTPRLWPTTLTLQQDAMPARRGAHPPHAEQEADRGGWHVNRSAAAAAWVVSSCMPPALPCRFALLHLAYACQLQAAAPATPPPTCRQMKQLRREVADLLRAGKQGNARIRWVLTVLAPCCAWPMLAGAQNAV